MEKQLLEIGKKLISEDIELDTAREGFDEWDSLVHVMLIAELDEKLGISIPVEEIDNIGCLRDVMRYV